MKDNIYSVFKPAFDSLRSFVQGKLKHRQLFHYTTLSTFDAFLKDDAHLYCTHYAALNDSSELHCGLDVVCKHLQKENGISLAVCTQLKECFEEGCWREATMGDRAVFSRWGEAPFCLQRSLDFSLRRQAVTEGRCRNDETEIRSQLRHQDKLFAV